MKNVLPKFNGGTVDLFMKNRLNQLDSPQSIDDPTGAQRAYDRRRANGPRYEAATKTVVIELRVSMTLGRWLSHFDPFFR